MRLCAPMVERFGTSGQPCVIEVLRKHRVIPTDQYCLMFFIDTEYPACGPWGRVYLVMH